MPPRLGLPRAEARGSAQTIEVNPRQARLRRAPTSRARELPELGGVRVIVVGALAPQIADEGVEVAGAHGLCPVAVLPAEGARGGCALVEGVGRAALHASR